MREPFLFYTENVMMTTEEKEAKAARRARKPSDPRERSKAPQVFRRQDRPAKPDGLTKQTYSAWVTLPGTTTARKWHLTAYFTGNDYHGLPTVDQDPVLSQLPVPPNVYVTGKGLTRKSDRRPTSQDLDAESRLSPDLDQRSSVSSDCGVSPLTPSPISSFTQYRNNGPYWGKSGDPTASPWSASSTLSLTSSTPPLPSPLHHPPSSSAVPPYSGYFPQGTPAYIPQIHATPVRGPTLPPLVSMDHRDAERLSPSVPFGNTPPQSGYSSRSLEDQRAVSAFRLQL